MRNPEQYSREITEALRLGRRFEKFRKRYPEIFHQKLFCEENDLANRLIAYFIFYEVMNPEERRIRLADIRLLI